MLLGKNADYRLRGTEILFRHLPLCLFSVLQRNTLKTRIIPNSLSYRLSVDWGVCSAVIGGNMLEM